MNIFVSNINYATREDQLQELFSEFGEVTSCKIITDRETGRSRGFGFIAVSYTHLDVYKRQNQINRKSLFFFEFLKL